MPAALGTRVTAQQRQDWDRDGWLVLKDLLPGKARRTLDAW